MKKVLILGGGFAGLEAAIFLRKYNIEVTLISNRKYFYVFPTSIWIPTGEQKFEDTCVDLKLLSEIHKFDFIEDEVIEIDKNNKNVICKNNNFNYEYLIIAMGANKTNYEGEDNFNSICGKPNESILLKKQIDDLIKKGNGDVCMGFGGNKNDPSSVRGGPAFELIFNLHNKLKKLGIRENYNLTFFAPMEKPGNKMGEKSSDMINVYFDKLNIKKQFGKKIINFEKDKIIFEDNINLKSDLTMFIPAGRGYDIFEESNFPLNQSGFIEINDFCEVNGEDNIFAIGDCAALEGPEWKAKQGHIAEVMARNTAFNILQKENKNKERKGYKEHINILCVMDTGDGAVFVYRDGKGSKMFPMPLVGHWMKKGWGWYCRNSKQNKFPRLPGM